ncbi:(2Fe-2S) ferredoxin domain-containing protein [Candidatus Peregrinibacteria bacterium]|nr:MAG: (2Fe-2S) ferredoxin domain-containing protein [Candidatus Peregrinibacteria bacterium]
MKKIVHICTGGACSQKNKAILQTAEEEKRRGAPNSLSYCGCLKKCQMGPNIKIVENDRERIKTEATSQDVKREMTSIQQKPSRESVNNLLFGGF